MTKREVEEWLVRITQCEPDKNRSPMGLLRPKKSALQAHRRHGCCAPQWCACTLSLHHHCLRLTAQTKAVLAALFQFGLAPRRRLGGKWQTWESPVWWQKGIHDYKGNFSLSFRAKIYPAWELNMLAQLKYSSGVRKAAACCAQTLPWQMLLPVCPTCSLTLQSNAHTGAAWGSKRHAGVVRQDAQVALTAKHLETNEGSWKKWRRELEVSRMTKKMGKQGPQGCEHATTLHYILFSFTKE